MTVRKLITLGKMTLVLDTLNSVLAQPGELFDHQQAATEAMSALGITTNLQAAFLLYRHTGHRIVAVLDEGDVFNWYKGYWIVGNDRHGYLVFRPARTYAQAMVKTC